ncbi:LysR family transcriptional regulator, hydrogen peroxide-inducible genes activator [Nocardia farcinica]|uniref:Probable hydrogen peroxide-inducible genes activator n=1 Tax=Nocardia farcinica TaxID=37329 RepID=A0A0H5NTP7_NOCFR|nr:putative hydrogen peroxide-inducible genes activator [Nocardia farcinica]PFX10312.1 putative hydrogen peroxide-inducible genes activator [Nocardia farcinica]CRY73391.1 Morphology and auto-aggregation control protein [Nocardia farcinica]SIT29363.1 LysR family transcriptional regulator, hydrogen peroxide-inducible genes activator [Nocardia farcinica]SUE27291.1 LysR family transcriptional regulator [Nocardia farcinica]
MGGTRLIGVSDQTYQPTLSQLRAFVAIAEYRHFGTAAARLGVSQPTLSQALAALENGLGLQLIERSTRRVLVTAAGTRLLPQAIATLEAADRFVASATGDGLGGMLRLGIIPTVAPYILPGLLPPLRERLPTLVPQIIEDQTARLLEGLRTGVLDAALLALPADNQGLTEIPLFTEEFVLVTPRGHELAGRTDIAPGVLASLPLLLLDEGHCLRDQTLELCRSVEVDPLAVGDTRAASLATVVQCVAGGLGVTLIPEMAVEAETARGTLDVARFSAPAPGRTIGLVFRSSSARAQDYEYLAAIIRANRPS